jgi:FAD/FMN-containing dehydrogenase
MPTDDLPGALCDALRGRVCLPDTSGYRESLGRVFFPDAARRRPSCVVQPLDTADVAQTMKLVAAHGGAVTVRGGGLSSTCVADGAVMIDLSVHLASVSPRGDGDSVVVGGGAMVGAVLDSLADSGRVIPVGIATLAGFGLVTRGGVGYLTRSFGLTLDHLLEVELVLPSGDVVRLSDDSRGADAQLWWAVRGCAPCFGVVTSAVLRTRRQGPVFVDRAVVGLEALPTYFATAPELARETSMGAVLGYVPDGAAEQSAPVLFIYSACRSGRDADIAAARAATTAVASGASVTYRKESIGPYLSGLPEFAIPGPKGQEPRPIAVAADDADRGWFYGKSVFCGPTLGDAVAAGLEDVIRAAPTRACRIDFQHTGGALADVADTATAFWGRGGEWNVPLNAIWQQAADGAACLDWARRALEVLADDTIGVYSVELRPGFPETEREVERAFGGNLARLRALRHQTDPAGLLNTQPL